MLTINQIINNKTNVIHVTQCLKRKPSSRLRCSKFKIASDIRAEPRAETQEPTQAALNVTSSTRRRGPSVTPYKKPPNTVRHTDSIPWNTEQGPVAAHITLKESGRKAPSHVSASRLKLIQKL